MYGLVIRPANQYDFKDINKLRQFLNVMENLMDTTGIGVRQCLEILAPSNKVVYISLLHDIIVGTASLIIDKKFGHYPRNAVGFIEDVAVHEDYRKKGIGAALLKKCEETAREFGAYKLILNCNSENLPWYESNGFYMKSHGMRKDLQ